MSREFAIDERFFRRRRVHVVMWVTVICAALAVMVGCAPQSSTANAPIPIAGPYSSATTTAADVATTTATATDAATATAEVPTTAATAATAEPATTAPSTSTTNSAPPHGDSTQQFEFGGLTRTYLVHVPPTYDGSTPVPLVVSFHGHGGTGANQAKLTQMSDVADASGFIVVYPDGVNHAWNDGRSGINGAEENIDDSGFVRELIGRLEKQYAIDAHRVYATGFSNGGFMCYRVASDMPDLVAAIAPVSGLLSQELASAYTSTTPVSLLLIAGTADPLVPFGGGEVAGGITAGRGMVYGALETARFFVNLDGCRSPGQTVVIPNTVLTDSARATRTSYVGGRAGTEVQLYTVIGGGHTWPGGLQYSPVQLTGPTCRDFDASKVIWEFFATHSRGS
jgi:polyhydroxybutyrate depolymerase